MNDGWFNFPRTLALPDGAEIAVWLASWAIAVSMACYGIVRLFADVRRSALTGPRLLVSIAFVAAAIAIIAWAQR